MMLVAWGLAVGVVAALATTVGVRYAISVSASPRKRDVRRKLVRLQVSWVLFGALFGVVAHATSNAAFDWALSGMVVLYVAITVATAVWVARKVASGPGGPT